MVKCFKIVNDNKNGYFAINYIEVDKSNLDHVTKLLPKGGYTTFRTYEKTKVLRFDHHIYRIINSGKLLNIDISINNIKIREILKNIISVFSDQERNYRIRIVIDFEVEIGQIYLLIENLVPIPESSYTKGIACITNNKVVRENPRAKLTNFIYDTEYYRENRKQDVNEILLVDNQNFIIEGMTSNFFAVKNGIIYTSNQNILMGITRELVVSVIKKNELKINYNPIRLDDISSINEAFITSSSRGVLPVIKINNITINGGFVGEYTKIISNDTQQKITSEIEEL